MERTRAKRHAIIICTRGRRADFSRGLGTELLQAALPLDATDGLGKSFAMRTVACMANCGFPCAVALTARGNHATIFADIRPDTDPPALVAFTALHRERSDGFTRAAGNLRYNTISRAPYPERKPSARGDRPTP